MKMKKSTKAVVNTLQNILIFMLVASLLMLFGVYVYTENSGASANLPPFPENHMHLISKEAQWATKSGSSAYVSPSFTAFTTDGMTYGGYFEKGVIWTEFERILSLLSSSDVKKEEFANKAEAFEYIDELFSSENMMYCEFAKPLSLMSVAVFFENTYNDSLIYKESFFVKYMLMLSGSHEEAWLALISENGEVVTVKPQTAFKIGENFAELIPDKSISGVEFVLVDEARNDGHVGYVPVFTTLKNLPVIEEKGFSSLYDIRPDSPAVATIVSAFGMNPNNTNRYFSPMGTGFVESAGQLNISTDGHIRFSCDVDGGVHISKLIGHNAISFSDTVSAVCSILDSFDKGILGNDARLVLERVLYDGDNDRVSFELAYYVGGIRIDSDRDADAVLVFSDTALVEASVYAGAYYVTEESYGDYLQKAALLATKTDDRIIKRFYASYISQGGGVYQPRWTTEYYGKD